MIVLVQSLRDKKHQWEYLDVESGVGEYGGLSQDIMKKEKKWSYCVSPICQNKVSKNFTASLQLLYSTLVDKCWRAQHVDCWGFWAAQRQDPHPGARLVDGWFCHVCRSLHIFCIAVLLLDSTLSAKLKNFVWLSSSTWLLRTSCHPGSLQI